MSSQSEQSLIETEALPRSDTEVMNADVSAELAGDYIRDPTQNKLLIFLSLN